VKHLSIILNIVLALAVGVLYYLHFSSAKGSDSIPLQPKDIKPSALVYINSDTLLAKYELSKRMRSDLEEKNRKSQAELEAKAKKFDEELQSLQQRAATFTREQAQAAEESLKQKQQQILMRREELAQQLTNEEGKLHEQLYTAISDYLRKYSKSANYKFVLGYSRGGALLYANDSLDITGQVLDGLNKEYKERNK
jgi:outer membrane protein